MKILKILLICFLFFTTGVNAQFGNPNGTQGMNRNNRMPSTQSTPKEPTPAEIEKNRTAQVDRYMATLKTDLSLDELQYIAIKNEMINSSKRMDIVLKSDYSDEEKNAEMKSIQETMEKNILSYLNPSQKEKFALLKTQKPEKKKKKNRGNVEQSGSKEEEKETDSNN
ncbi:hypothetical protein WMW71_11115 [Flavobacterium buctense]|uniref:DUF4890 domain-containing protein n=1 Tax=Flavobacterium buctense TaxID=1648146 RepID=A0ABU9E4F0_9FLAO|nr:hypothetical protein [Flavobacterium buctense]